MRYKLQHFIDYKTCETENHKTTKKNKINAIVTICGEMWRISPIIQFKREDYEHNKKEKDKNIFETNNGYLRE